MNIDPRLAKIKDCLYRCATKAIIIKDNKMLFVKEKDDNWWNLPGGGIDYGEDAMPALVRELAEEIGVSEAQVQEISTPLFVSTDGEVDAVPRLNIYYWVKIEDGSEKLGKDVEDMQWMSADQIAELPLSPSLESSRQKCIILVKGDS